MVYLNRVFPIPGIFWAVAIPLAAATLGSCSEYSRGAVQTRASKPVVSYVYSDDEGLMDATRKAEGYCAQYGAWATTEDIVSRSDGRHVTFVCDQPRAPIATAPTTTVVVPPQSPVSYPYRDERSLVDATANAQRYCIGFNAYARSTIVTTNADGSRTVSFECVRTGG
jgi:hypothetical protein